MALPHLIFLTILFVAGLVAWIVDVDRADTPLAGHVHRRRRPRLRGVPVRLGRRMIPRGHLLGHPRRWRGLYVATCACGLDVYGLTLPALWERHQAHLDATRTASQANHPSRRKP